MVQLRKIQSHPARPDSKVKDEVVYISYFDGYFDGSTITWISKLLIDSVTGHGLVYDTFIPMKTTLIICRRRSHLHSYRRRQISSSLSSPLPHRLVNSFQCTTNSLAATISHQTQMKTFHPLIRTSLSRGGRGDMPLRHKARRWYLGVFKGTLGCFRVLKGILRYFQVLGTWYFRYERVLKVP